MTGSGTPALAAALICFALYFGNVMLGAVGTGVLLGDVAEMLMLLVAVVLFVIGILAREALEKSESGKD
jgi:hypothetical protein